jgi:hypothetical protein
MRFGRQFRHGAAQGALAAMGPSLLVELRTGAPPASEDDPDAGELLVSIALPAEPFAVTPEGALRKQGPWQGLTGLAGGQPEHFRLKGGGATHAQGHLSLPDRGGDMTIDTQVLAPNRPVAVVDFVIVFQGEDEA